MQYLVTELWEGIPEQIRNLSYDKKVADTSETVGTIESCQAVLNSLPVSFSESLIQAEMVEDEGQIDQKGNLKKYPLNSIHYQRCTSRRPRLIENMNIVFFFFFIWGIQMTLLNSPHGRSRHTQMLHAPHHRNGQIQRQMSAKCAAEMYH